MANAETKQLDAIISSRRQLLAIGGVALAGLAFAPKAQAQAAVTDNDILNFALNLEYLEAQFYNLAANGVTIDQLPTPIPVAVNGGTAGSVTLKPSFAAVPFSSTLIRNYALETAVEEGKHVLFLQSALGKNAVSMPNIDLYNSFNGLATLAGLGSAFDPFASDANFLIGADIFEDTGVSAYAGAAALISDKTVVLPAAAGILAVEAYHAGLIRTSINELDAGAGVLTGYTQAISATRTSLANGGDGTVDDIGVTTTMVALNGTAATYSALTIADADTSTSLAFERDTTQVLAIVTAGGVTTGGTTTFTGGFFPSGLNGNIA